MKKLNSDHLKCSYIKNHHKSWVFQTLHSYFSYSFPSDFAHQSFVCNSEKETVCFSFFAEGKKFLVLGTDIAEDLIRLRQGDPAEVARTTTKSAWGFDFERPLYLYQNQIDHNNKIARPVDSWMLLLIKIFQNEFGIQPHSLLPQDSKGAILLTGDDDQAFLEEYTKQLNYIGKTPITYFMHPQTKVTRQFLKTFSRTNHIELGLHPDALDEPSNYNSLCREQTSWFIKKFLKLPFSVRNHGYLNDGYWGHLSSWRSLGLRFSSNLPGFDGTILTGSLIPPQ